MTSIVGVLAVPAVGAYYHTDLKALQADPLPLEDQYTASPASPGFRRVRQVAEGVSVGLVLSDGLVAWGDCVSVAYGGKSGSDPVFRTAEGLSTIRQEVAPALEGRRVTTFRELAAAIEAVRQEVRVPAPAADELSADEKTHTDDEGLSRRDLLTAPLRRLRPAGSGTASTPTEEPGPTRYITVERPLHSAIRYGVSQALLKAVALAHRLTMAEVIADEWTLPQPGQPVPIHAQSGAERRKNADKMIVRRVASLPHALVEDIPNQLGEDGEKLVHYARWLTERIKALGGPDYRPTIHLDVHGALGHIYENDLGRILGYLYRMESSVLPYRLRVESPVIMETHAGQIEAMQTLRESVRFRKMAVEIVADEWANTHQDIQAFIDAEAADMIQIKTPDLGSLSNTVEAVLACQEAGVGAFLGGSCAETDLAARAAVHIALATQPDLIMARPGMGVDEGVSIVENEMTRALVLIKTRDSR
jgi:methylaspartate ammonia-lyase